MKISELIKLLEARKKQFGNIDVVDDLGYITNDVIYNEDDNWAFKRERPNLKITIIDNLYDKR